MWQVEPSHQDPRPRVQSWHSSILVFIPTFSVVRARCCRTQNIVACCWCSIRTQALLFKIWQIERQFPRCNLLTRRSATLARKILPRDTLGFRCLAFIQRRGGRLIGWRVADCLANGGLFAFKLVICRHSFGNAVERVVQSFGMPFRGQRRCGVHLVFSRNRVFRECA